MSSSRSDFIRRVKSRRGKECEVSWCREKVTGLSRYCSTHRSRRRTTGDPKGSTLRRSHVRLHAAKAKDYLLSNRGHKVIEDGLAWTSWWLNWGEYYSPSWRCLTPTQQARQYLHRLNGEGIHEAEVFATIISVSYIRQYEQAYIRSDDHFRFQTIVQVLGLAPWPSEDRNGKVRQRYFRPTPKAVEVLWNSIPNAILVLAHGIAKKIREHEIGPTIDAAALNTPLPAYLKETQ